jgi:hypothetical protein
MNTHPTVQAILDRRGAQEASDRTSQETFSRDSTNQDRLFTVLAMFLDHVVQDLQEGTLKTEVTNHPPVQPIAGSVQIDKAEALEERLDALLEATAANRTEPVENQVVSGTVSIDNFPDEKEIRFPEYPRQIKTDVVSLPKYVGDKLDELKAAIRSLPAPVVNVPPQPTPQVHMDLQPVVDQLEAATSLLGTLAAYEAKDEPLDLSPLVSAVKAVQEQIMNQKFPVPNFQSSWQHSRYQQSLDANMAYTYNAYGEVDTLSVVLGDGTYTQTLTNATISTPSAIDGLTTHRAVTSRSAWNKTG